MKRFNSILQSPIVRGLALIIGVLAGLSAIFARIFPDPSLTRLIAYICLAAVVLFLVITLLEKLVRPESEIAYKYSAKRYGIGYGELTVTCTIRGGGSALIERQVTVEAYSRLSSLETSLLIPEPSTTGKKREFTSRPRIETTTDHNVSIAKVIEQERKQFAEITFSPELREDEIGGFKMTENIPPGVYAIDLSKEELEKRKTPYDYFGWNTDRPTRALHLRVYFPDGVKPKIYGSEVRYAPVMQDITTTRLQYEEQKRVTGPSLVDLGGERYVLNLNVDYPMVGLIYMVRWQPPATGFQEKTEVDKKTEGASGSID